MVALERFFSFGGQKNWSLVALDRWSSCKVTIVGELAWANSVLVVLDMWSSYRGSCISRFDSRMLKRWFNGNNGYSI